MPESERPDRLGQSPRLLRVDRLRLARSHTAKSTVARACGAENEEGGRFAPVAFRPIGATRMFADRGERLLPEQFRGPVHSAAFGKFHFHPPGEWSVSVGGRSMNVL